MSNRFRGEGVRKRVGERSVDSFKVMFGLGVEQPQRRAVMEPTGWIAIADPSAFTRGSLVGREPPSFSAGKGSSVGSDRIGSKNPGLETHPTRDLLSENSFLRLTSLRGDRRRGRPPMRECRVEPRDGAGEAVFRRCTTRRQGTVRVRGRGVPRSFNLTACGFRRSVARDDSGSRKTASVPFGLLL